ncbi:MAG TPA: NAD(P)/FAD-dependent oxidoreductase [Nitrospiria bacterium]
MDQRFDVIIIGGGMGGLILAWTLGQKGRKVALVERQADLRPPFRGELLQPNGIRILDRVGLLDGVRNLPLHKAHRFHFFGIGKGRLCSVDYRVLPEPWNYALITTPVQLLPFLLERLKSQKTVTVLTGTEFKEPVFDGDGVAGALVDGGDGPTKLLAPMLVGSDGAFSRVREGLGIASRVHIYREGYLTMVISRPAGHLDEARYFVGKSRILGLFPVSEKELYLFYMVKGSNLEQIREGRLQGITDAIAGIEPSLRKPLEEVKSWNQVGFMPCMRVRADTWVNNGAALIGDAAHAMNPHVAQGRNQAMEDAMALAGTLESCFEKGEFSASNLREYETGRRRVVEQLQKTGDELTLLWNAGFPLLTWLRDRIFRGMDRHPGIRTKVVRMISGTDIQPLPLWDRIRVLIP